MTTSTSPIQVRRVVRGATNRQIFKANRARDRRGRLDRITYTYRHTLSILSATGATVIAVVVGETLYHWIVR